MIHKALGIIGRLVTVVTIPIWVPAVLAACAIAYAGSILAWPFYWIITGRGDYEDRFLL